MVCVRAIATRESLSAIARRTVDIVEAAGALDLTTSTAATCPPPACANGIHSANGGFAISPVRRASRVIPTIVRETGFPDHPSTTCFPIALSPGHIALANDSLTTATGRP